MRPLAPQFPSVEDALRHSEALRSAILDASLDAIVSMDHRGLITQFNAAAEEIFGYHRQDVVGRPMGEVIIPPHLREPHRRGLQRYLSTGEAHVIGRRIEIDAMRADGSTFPVELAITVLPGIDPPTFTGFLRDITERRRADEDLRRLNAELQARAAEERALRAVAEGLTGAVEVPEVMREVAEGALVISGAVGAFVEQVVTPKADVEVVSAVGEHIPPVGTRVAYPGSLTEEIIERRESAFLVRMQGLGVAMAPYLAEHCAGCSVLVVPLLVGREVFGALVLLRRPDEPPFEHGVVNRARTLGDLASLALQRVMVLAESEHRRAVAEAAVRSRDEVLSIVSHDLRTPVSTVVMGASLLADDTLQLSEQERRKQLDVIKRSAERMNRLIQ
ncbi:MAG: PAS domain S-box protein, partial [Gemmatimonadaceae bacterium]